MALTLGQKQELFSWLHPRLVDKAHELGFEVRLKELERGDEQAEFNANHCRLCGANVSMHGPQHTFRPIGTANSLHCDGLAQDLYLRQPPSNRILWATEHYRPLGEFWEGLHALTYWGGRTDKPGDRLKHDGGHFSITHGGRQ
jgi:hypothetical protein